MTTLTIGYEQARDLLEMAVAEKPAGFFYERPMITNRAGTEMAACAYFDRNGDPSCMVGQVIHRMGFGLDSMDPDNNQDGAELNLMGVISLIKHGYMECDFRTFILLTLAQQSQDEKEPWRNAYRKAVIGSETIKLKPGKTEQQYFDFLLADCEHSWDDSDWLDAEAFHAALILEFGNDNNDEENEAGEEALPAAACIPAAAGV